MLPCVVGFFFLKIKTVDLTGSLFSLRWSGSWEPALKFNSHNYTNKILKACVPVDA